MGIPEKTPWAIALNCYKSGQFDRAGAICAEMLSHAPADPRPYFLLGAMSHRKGDLDSAISFMEKAVALAPSNAVCHNWLGVCYQLKSRLKDAVASFHRSISANPAYADAYDNLGLALQKKAESRKAIICHQKALSLRPDCAQTHYNLGNAHKKVGQLIEAAVCYEKAIRLKPDYYEAFNNLATTLHSLGRTDEAIKYLAKALEIKPDRAMSYYNMGHMLQERLRFDEAVAAYKRAIRLQPDFSEAYNNLAIALKEMGLLQEALSCYRKAIRLNPNFSKAHSDLLLAMHYDIRCDRRTLFEEARAWWRQHGLPLADRFIHHRGAREDKPIRAGYVSPDFRGHSVGYFFLPLLQHINREKVETVSYSLTVRPDEMTSRIQALSGTWRSAAGLSDDELARQIYRDRIDILIDLAGHTANNRLRVFAQRPAPVQVTWLGYPDTTGLEVMDYRISDEIADPSGESEIFHTETLIRLQDGFLCYMPPDNAPPVSESPLRKAGRITFGSFNNLPKVNERVAEIWSRILRQVPRSRLLLKSKQLSNAAVRKRCLDMFLKSGITPDRIKLHPATASLEAHLRLYNEVDIGLDPFPYNGTTTTCETLWMGIPVVTLKGDRHSARVGASILTRIGLDFLVCDTEQGYVRTAVALASDSGTLNKLRKGMRERMIQSPLCDGASFARRMETAYQEMWDNWLRFSHKRHGG
ncbi:MAG: tetratricopeptide repeat protein [Deltaproteobacteria bacterium]|nr:tetratricopeptide repeat protein [Deltaproteobacteria bacterium]